MKKEYKSKILIAFFVLLFILTVTWNNNAHARLSKAVEVAIVDVKITTINTPSMNISGANPPTMPAPTFHAEIIPAELSSPDATFRWYMEITFTQHGRNDYHRIPAEGTVDITGSTDWTPQLGDLFAGGNVSVYISISTNELELFGVNEDFEIQGTNSPKEQILAVTTSDEEKAVCWRESAFDSGFRQFNATEYTGIGWPLWGTLNGWGLMQLDPPEGPKVNGKLVYNWNAEKNIWNWNYNLNNGIDYLSDIYEHTQSWLIQMYNQDYEGGNIWAWEPSDSIYNDRIWDDAFSRYNSGKTSYSPQGHCGERNCDNNPETNPNYYEFANPTGCDYANTIRSYINSIPWENN